MKEIICITCPKGCHLKVDEETFAVTGNSCPRGAVYGANELRNPVRVVTSTVVVKTSPDKGRGTGEAGGGVAPRRLPVKTDRPIPKGKMFEVMDEIARPGSRGRGPGPDPPRGRHRRECRSNKGLGTTQIMKE